MLVTGTKLGRYEIRSQLGTGGMGEVYRARDTQLGRDVAIKVIPSSVAVDKDRLRRFEQEACAAGALNHPNILVVHDIAVHDGSPYVVSELLEGETLRKRIAGTPLNQRRVIEYALQIANGLATAHEKGIIHRDLKPDNVFITNDGRVKILDFGLAKLTQLDGNESQTEVPTRRVDTDPGVVMGTLGYMSPEQLKGRAVDQRSDIFSFGAILYEMLSGRRAFHGESAAETMSAILREDPPELSNRNKNVSPGIERLVNRCLEKNPEARFHSASDLAFALEALSVGGVPSDQNAASTVSVPTTLKPSEYLSWIIAAVAVVGLLATLGFFIAKERNTQIDESVLRLSVALPENITMSGTIPTVVVSPDGRRLAFVATKDGENLLWVRPLDSFTPQLLGSIDSGGAPSPPFWSPDSRFIAFFSGGKLKKIDAAGGPPQIICDFPAARGGTWNREGVIIVGSTAGPLYRVSQAGGEPTLLTSLDESRFETSHRWPYFLPDGQHFLYFARTGKVETTGIHVGSLNSKDTKQLMPSVVSVAYAHPGFLLFLRNDTLLAQPFDVNELKLTGEQVPIAEHVAYNPGLGRGAFSVSDNGILIFRAGGGSIDQPLWFDRTGKQIGAVGEPGMYFNLGLSPVDQRQIAVDRTDPQTGTNDIWLFDLSRDGVSSRFTTDPGNDYYPLWSPNGNSIVFTSNRDGRGNLYRKAASGGGNEELLFKSAEEKLPDDWSSDGQFIALEIFNPNTKWDLWVLRVNDKELSPVLQSNFNERQAQFSPDGKYITYVSDKSGSLAVYVQTFPPSGNEWRISAGGGAQPRWRHDGRELFYIAPDRKLMAVDITLSPRFEASVPKTLFDTRVLTTSDFRNHYVVTADGQRFLINSFTEERGTIPINVVKNWSTLLKR
jgi:eukaryotic-like serine/threonine-protein kinase